MAKKIVAPRVTPKQKFAAYKESALRYIGQLRNPGTRSAFFVASYNVQPGTGIKKPNTLSAPELLAIVGTARQLGKEVRITVSGRDDNAQLNFEYVDVVPAIPLDLF